MGCSFSMSSTRRIRRPQRQTSPISPSSGRDISYLTIIREITNGIRNDLGMYINGRYLILIEAQTTWSVNILVRMFIYLAEIWKNHIVQNGLDVFASKAIELPMPEFYVVYTGSRKTLHGQPQDQTGLSETVERSLPRKVRRY